MGQWLTRYAARGWKLFPVEVRGKKPLINANLTAATTDPGKIKIWGDKWPRCNWGVSLARSGLVCVDIDAAGIAIWQGLIEQHGEPQTLRQLSGSGVGKHYVFKAREGAKYRGQLEGKSGKVKGIDVKHNGYILVEPSVHPSGGVYRWDAGNYDTAAIFDVPAWLAGIIEKPVAAPKEPRPLASANAKQYVALIDKMREKPLDYQQWLTCGQALHAEFSGSDEGLTLWLELTRGVSYQPGDEEKAADKWAGFSSDGGRTMGSLYHVAKEQGVEIPNPTLALDKIAFAQNAFTQRRAELKVGWFYDDVGRQITVSERVCVDYFNDQGYCVVGNGNLYREGMEAGMPVINSVDRVRFEQTVSDVWLKQYDENGDSFLTPARDVWMGSTKRQKYSRIVFAPKTQPGEYNLWAPIPCVAHPGDVSDVLALVKDVICSGHVERADYFLDWLAHMVQKPHDKPAIVPVLIGAQGSGKGLLTDGYLSGILGPLYLRIDHPGMLTQQFNAIQAKRFLTVLDEASWKGHHNLSNLLKSLTGSTTMLIEEKFGPQYTIPNLSRFVITSNDLEAVRIEPGNRRYFVLEMTAPASPEFYQRAWDTAENGTGCAAFYDYLMRRDISDFNCRIFPEHLDTQGKETKVRSLLPSLQFWGEIILEEPRRLWRREYYCGREILVLDKRTVYSNFVEWAGGKNSKRATSVMQFWSESVVNMGVLSNMVRLGNSERARVILCSPGELRAAFCERNRIPIPVGAPSADEYIAESDFTERPAPASVAKLEDF